MERYIKDISEEISQELIKIIRSLHRIPELANEEMYRSNCHICGSFDDKF